MTWCHIMILHVVKYKVKIIYNVKYLPLVKWKATPKANDWSLFALGELTGREDVGFKLFFPTLELTSYQRLQHRG